MFKEAGLSRRARSKRQLTIADRTIHSVPVMGTSKKQVRAAFRRAVYTRAAFRCQGPGCSVVATAITAEDVLDAHHITDRNLLPGGGYVAENGIALCKDAGGCHEKAEQYHATGTASLGFAPDDLYAIIGSTLLAAEAASHRLCK